MSNVVLFVTDVKLECPEYATHPSVLTLRLEVYGADTDLSEIFEILRRMDHRVSVSLDTLQAFESAAHLAKENPL